MRKRKPIGKKPAKAAANTSRTRGLRPPWKPGEVPNPKGRPRGAVSFVTRLRKLLADGRIDADALLLTLARVGQKGSVRAISELIDRIDGKAVQKIDGLIDQDQKIRVTVAGLVPDAPIDPAMVEDVDEPETAQGSV